MVRSGADRFRGMGKSMKKLACATALAIACSTASGLAADMKATKAPPPPPVVSPWDIAFGSAVMSDYNFRGITQSNHHPSVASYFEPRYNFTDALQGYVGISGESISFPNRAAAEIDLYGGVRPSFGKLALDFGYWYYWYPGGTCFNAAVPGECRDNADAVTGGLPINGNVIKSDLSFWEIYAKGTYTVNDQFSFGGSVYWSPSVLNSGADGIYLAGTAKYVLPTVSPVGSAGSYPPMLAIGSWVALTGSIAFRPQAACYLLDAQGSSLEGSTTGATRTGMSASL